MYVEGEEPEVLSCELPENNQTTYTVRKEIVLRPGDQYTIEPNIKHWFQAGETGAVVTEFSSSSDDASDIFTNPMIQR
ncbi:D-lyxose ketol-isomerase [bioreactor metagenome]|uniref:D-lyxose ketol-isomerase n=1 Tax=bioreactor metagenome TaxID=1076179 RepID=A0A645CY74_9ZZZZ